MRQLKQIGNFLLQHWMFLFFTVVYFVFSFLTYKDFGTTYDERVAYTFGKYLIEYYKNPNNKIFKGNGLSVEERQLPLNSPYSRIYPALLNIFNPNFYLEHFHLENLLFGCLIFLLSYSLFFIHYKNQKKAIVAPLFLVLTPSVFGHLPANPKDIPFAIVFLLGILAIHTFQIKKFNNYFEILILGVIFGVAFSIRTVGLTLMFSFVFCKLLYVSKLNIKNTSNLFLQTSLIFLIALLIWAICLPYLGANLPANFFRLLNSASDFAPWDNKILYFGKILTKNQRPWHYLFVYLLIKLPLFIWAVINLGSTFAVSKKIKYSVKHPLINLTFLSTLNIALYLIINPVVYNGIRHFIYLSVIVVLISAFLFIDAVDVLRKKSKLIFLTIMLYYFAFTTVKIANLHPYEYVYFNELVGGIKGAENKFEVDYWGAAYKEGAEYIRGMVEEQNLSDVKVYACDNQYAVNYYAQYKFELQNRSANADFIICDTFKDNQRKEYNDTHSIIYEIKRENVTLLRIRAKENE